MGGGEGTVTGEICSETPRHPHLTQTGRQSPHLDPQALHDLPPITSLSLPPPSLPSQKGLLHVSPTRRALCRDCSLCLLSPLPPAHSSLPQVFAQMSPSQQGPSLPLYFNSYNPPTITSPLSPTSLFSVTLTTTDSIMLFFYLSPPLGCKHHRGRSHIYLVHCSFLGV